MGFLSHLLYPWGLLLQGFAIVHFIRRRPDMYWIFIILFLGPLGALIYIFVEVIPDLGLLRQSFKVFPRRKRINELETMVRDNPSSGNYEELDPFYRRGVCALLLADAAAAIPDLERAVGHEADYDFHRAAGLLAHAYAQTGQKERAEALFRQSTITSTLSETYLNFASLLASEGRNAEAREWAQKVLDKKPTMPAYLRRRERPWFRSAHELLRRLPA
jgi:hypothetical protein